jgi:hypothetical protein
MTEMLKPEPGESIYDTLLQTAIERDINDQPAAAASSAPTSSETRAQTRAQRSRGALA